MRAMREMQNIILSVTTGRRTILLSRWTSACLSDTLSFCGIVFFQCNRTSWSTSTLCCLISWSLSWEKNEICHCCCCWRMQFTTAVNFWWVFDSCFKTMSRWYNVITCCIECRLVHLSFMQVLQQMIIQIIVESQWRFSRLEQVVQIHRLSLSFGGCSTSANSTSDNSTSASWPKSNWPKSKLAEVEIGRTRNWPNSKLAEVEQIVVLLFPFFFFLFLFLFFFCFSFSCFFFFFSFSVSFCFSLYLFVFLVSPKPQNSKPKTPNPKDLNT